jgi:ATP-dependent Lon protease
MNDDELTPVFPLPIVACPGEVVPLHIFEPRFKDMIARCRARQAEGGTGEFAIVFSEGGTWAETACLMQIAKILKTYDDGRLDLLTVGKRRCTLVAVESAASYPTGRAIPLSEAAGDWDEALANRVFCAHRRVIALVTGKEPPATDYAGHAYLSYYVLPTSGLPPRRKQEILNLPSEDDRLRALSEELDALAALLLRAHGAVNSIQTALSAAAALRE